MESPKEMNPRTWMGGNERAKLTLPRGYHRLPVQTGGNEAPNSSGQHEGDLRLTLWRNFHPEKSEQKRLVNSSDGISSVATEEGNRYWETSRLLHRIGGKGVPTTSHGWRCQTVSQTLVQKGAGVLTVLGAQKKEGQI